MDQEQIDGYRKLYAEAKELSEALDISIPTAIQLFSDSTLLEIRNLLIDRQDETVIVNKKNGKRVNAN